MDTLIDKNVDSETANWNDDEFHHAYRMVGKNQWDGGPALCGFKGPGPKMFSIIIPAGACPICVALVKEEWGEI